MNILVVGGGGREHALAWKLAQSPKASHVHVAPGNAGTAREPGVSNVDISAEDIDGLVRFATANGIGLTVIGPEAPLVLGIVDRFRNEGLACFGPPGAAARLEGSKSFAKDFLQRHAIPTAAYESFTEIEAALDYVRRCGAPIVVKADGLAAGKGVVLAETMEAAESAIREMLEDNRFGDAGSRVVVEEFLRGEEASFICMVGGGKVLPLATSQDHKARDNGDSGPNTGGMGAYSPAPVVDDATHRRIMEQVIEPTVKGLADDGIDYLGFLYAGLMIDDAGQPRVLEFNCRFGDPETQPILMRLQSDLVEHCLAAIEGELNPDDARWSEQAAVGVVLAAGGYPFEYARGMEISGVETAGNGLKVFHAGTELSDGRVVTAGGRVLCVTALGETVTEARRNAYDGVQQIQWKDMYYRTDIAHRAIARESAKR